MGTINIHPSLLPKYRGPQPLLWQYLDFDLNAGVTIHYIAKKEDTGDIIMQREFKIAIGTPYIQTVHNSENIGYQMIIDVMESIEKGQYTRIKQPEHSSTERAYRIDKKTIFERIQWEEWSVERIYHLLSGMFTAAELSKYAAELPLDKDLKIKGYSNNSHYPLSEVGKVIKHEKGFNIVCKNGLIQIAQNVVNMFVIVEVLNNI
ncbi:Bifunctional polymyxin resistance protein ArnA [compost metagenome]